ncbi:MAG: hypothetical protein PHE58_07230 [Candidatus Omnitrophica bacterium]|nr:hypothetical protein [Candidatus Omnitrophota bacterium]
MSKAAKGGGTPVVHDLPVYHPFRAMNMKQDVAGYDLNGIIMKV